LISIKRVYARIHQNLALGRDLNTGSVDMLGQQLEELTE